MAEAEGVGVDQRQAGERLGIVGLRRHRALEADANRLDHLAVEGPPVGVEEQHRRVAAEHLGRLSVGVARAVALDRAVGLGQRPRDPVRHLVAERDDLGRLETPLERLGPDGAAARRLDEEDVHLEAVRQERGLAGDQVVGGKLPPGGLGIDVGRMAQRGLRAEDAQPGEAGERDDQRPGEAAGEGREGRLVALLLEGGDQHPGRAGRAACGSATGLGAAEDRRRSRRAGCRCGGGSSGRRSGSSARASAAGGRPRCGRSSSSCGSNFGSRPKTSVAIV